METMIVEREKALWLVASMLAEYGADVKEGAHSELLQWANRIGDWNP